MSGRLLSALLALSLLFTCTSCAREAPVPPEPEESSSSPSSASSSSSEVDAAQEPMDLLRADYPITDGSTSLIPLDVGVRAAIFGISAEEAAAQVTHTTTYGCFYSLLEGTADLIFTVPMSEAQLAEAKQQGVALEQVPVAREGFVFVVNAQNPVDSLTQEQLRAIYSGEITNWSEVGGNDEPIVAYQRNSDSGSQNYMISFMGDTPLTDAPTEQRPASMSGLMDVIAANDYATQSIGYSVYAYAADMYGNGSEIKFLAVDGVTPSKATMASGEYPLLSNNYAVFRADEPEDSNVRLLCAWMTSDAGQLAIAEAGYVTVRDVGYDYAEDSAALWQCTGTGPAEWETPTTVSTGARPDGRDVLPLKITKPDKTIPLQRNGALTEYTTGYTYELNCLTNTALQTEINGWLAEAVARADAHSGELYDLLEQLIRHMDPETEYYTQATDHENNVQNEYSAATVEVKAKNGYIWATVTQRYYNGVPDLDQYAYFRTETATWDLCTGKRLTVSDFFPAGTDVDALLNGWLSVLTRQPLDAYERYADMNTDFFGLLQEDGWCINPEYIYFDTESAYFAHGIRFSLALGDHVMCTEAYRDMTDALTGSALLRYDPAVSQNTAVTEYVSDNLFTVELLDETLGDTAVRAKINAAFLQRISGITLENAQAYFEEQGVKNVTINSWMYRWSLTEFRGGFAMFSSTRFGICNDQDWVFWPESMGVYFFDLSTGSELSWTELLTSDWQKQCTVTVSKDGGDDISEVDATSLDPAGLPPLKYAQLDTHNLDQMGHSFLLTFEDADGNQTVIALPVTALHF